MKLVDRSYPLPFFTINKNHSIYSYSKEAKELFGEPKNLLEILDEDSVEKMKEWVTPDIHKASLEVHVKSQQEGVDLLTVDLHVKWDNDLYGEVLLIVKDEKLTKVTRTLDQLRSRLNDTNFELLEEKEKLEEAVEQNNQLSAPFIVLNDQAALIPLFGDITEEKMYSVESQLLQQSQESEVDQLLFDFTAVGEMQRSGVHVLLNVITSLVYMGSEISFIGVQPAQAKQLKEINLPNEIQFLSSLQMALNKYV
ncbi:STAS domain-containing protein [Halobacillus locisalis]|uniref:STAS domain-containing protein n=1 Tax=Halobacillus locisalis TaxID=220753 RepID=A0A838CVT2_9BACI|nr:STAS domain-containing protein [Halobacillus locisalis]MBA2175716.1 STAS domain-containing protein [Halobacillus locisalis]